MWVVLLCSAPSPSFCGNSVRPRDKKRSLKFIFEHIFKEIKSGPYFN